MVSITHADAAELADQDVRIPAGGRIMELDWGAVAQAFASASDEHGWDADFVIRPEVRHVWIRVPADRGAHIARTTLDFYSAVARRIGREEFMSIWVDFDVKPRSDVQSL